MKYINFSKLLFLISIVITMGCSNNSKQKSNESRPFIAKQTVTLESDLMTPEALWAMGRIGSVTASPKGDKIAYTVSYYSVSENRSHSVIYTMNADGSNNTMLTKTSDSEFAPAWAQNGEKILFLSKGKKGNTSLFAMNPDGSSRTEIGYSERAVQEGDTKFEEMDIEDFLLSPDEKKIILIYQLPYENTMVRGSSRYADLPKTTGLIVNELMHKHWDEWVETIPHPILAEFSDNKITIKKDILEGEPYECPSKPFGGSEQLAWSPDSKFIAYSCKKMEGRDYAISTDSDIYEYDVEKGTTTNLCKPVGYQRATVEYDKSLKNQAVNKPYMIDGESFDCNMGYDVNPSYSPDGQSVAWLSMERDGYESDRNRLCVLNKESGKKSYITEQFESGVDSYIWKDAQTLYFIGVWHGTVNIYSTNLLGEVTQITNGQHDYASLALSEGKLIAKRHSMALPDDIYSVDTESGEAIQITNENEHILSSLSLGEVKERWTTTSDGKQMLSWVVYPPHFDPSKKYPTLLFCEGGPQSPVSQFWSYRWNFQIMAANGYIIIAPNRRGLPGFGMEWLEEISGDYGGQCMKDYLSAIDDIAKEPYVDKERLGCVGASFGGFSVYWLAGNHNKRFKAFIAHDGMFNFNQQYLETEEDWFANWDLSGAFWRKDAEGVQKSYAASPHLFVDKWDTPILCIHSDKDYRILSSQGESAFNAARLRGVPAQLLLYPDENHWVLKPQNGILWQRTFFEWLDKWLKD